MHRPRALLCLLAIVACEDPARPSPDLGGSTLFVESIPQGARVSIDFEDTGEFTPALIDGLEEGAHNVTAVLDTSGFTYSFQELVVVGPEMNTSLRRPLTARCTNAQCLLDASQQHSPGNARFTINASGPSFLFTGVDVGIVWPVTTQNSYSPIGMPVVGALINGVEAALGLRNVGTAVNYWAGLPLPVVVSNEPYMIRIPAWITPPATVTGPGALRGLEVVQEVIVEDELPNVIRIRVRWTNVSADSIYRMIDPASPASGVTYTDAWLGFILDADVGSFGESNDDLVSYDINRRMVFGYDSDFEVSGFSGGWSTRPALVGLLVVDSAGGSIRLNAWPRSADYVAGTGDETGRDYLTATQIQPENHPDGRIGYAPNDEETDYIMSAAAGPFELAPGESRTLTFAVILAAPTPGTFTSGALLPAGDPLDGARPLATAAAGLVELADSVIGAPPIP